MNMLKEAICAQFEAGIPNRSVLMPVRVHPSMKKLAVNEITYKLHYTYSHPLRAMEDH